LRKTLTALLLTIGLLSGLTACGQSQPAAEPAGEETLSLEALYNGYMDAVSPDFAYDIALELSTNPAYFNSDQGGRNAGSDAEHATADYLADVMEEIGLTSVEKEAAQCDRWQFNGASLTVDGKAYAVYSYATASTPAGGLTAEVVYMGEGYPCGIMRAWMSQARSFSSTLTSAMTGGSPIPCWRRSTRAPRRCWRPMWAAMPRSQMTH